MDTAASLLARLRAEQDMLAGTAAVNALLQDLVRFTHRYSQQHPSFNSSMLRNDTTKLVLWIACRDAASVRTYHVVVDAHLVRTAEEEAAAG